VAFFSSENGGFFIMVCLQRAGSYLSWAILCIAIAGCGDGITRVTVTGKVVDGGEPYVIPEDEYEEGGCCVELEFCHLDESGEFEGDRFSVIAKSDGSFLVDGYEGDGIPLGKYRVALRRPTGEMTEDGIDDLFNGKFEPDNSPFEFDITETQKEPIVIDISKGAPASE